MKIVNNTKQQSVTLFQDIITGTVFLPMVGGGVWMKCYGAPNTHNAVDLSDGGLGYFGSCDKVQPLNACVVIEGNQ